MSLIVKEKPFMNTVITIKVVQNDESTVQILDAIEKAFGEFDRIVKKFTRFNENSELSNLNRNAGNWTQISEEFVELIEYMLNLAKTTDGKFDPTITDFLEIHGYDKNYDFSKLNNPDLDKIILERVKNRKSWKDIEVDKKNLKVKLAEKQKIDLGGVGKGYALDLAGIELRKVTNNFLVDGGGDIFASGKNEKNEDWIVAMKTKEGIKGYLPISNMALASSGSWARKVRDFHHLIDPTTGKSAERNYNTVFVLAPTGMLADSWATSLFVGGEQLAETLPKDIKVMFF